MSIGVMKDKKLKLRDLHVLYTLGYAELVNPANVQELTLNGCLLW